MKKRLAVLALVLLTLQSCKGQEKELIWEENFDGNSLNMDYWSYENGDGCPDICGWGNNERQLYRPENLEIKDGLAVITAEKNGDSYFSSRINTKDKFEFQYGIIETRAKVPWGHGIWPAIWMLGDNIGEVGWPASGEIDIMEYVGRMKDTLHTTLHTPATHGDHASTKVTKIDNVEDDFHIYKVEWSKQEIVYYIDGEKVYTFSPEIKDDEHYPFRHKFYFLLNMAIGGNFGGPDVDDSIFPAKFYIDYIKVYQ